jgi:hypothetical protein
LWFKSLLTNRKEYTEINQSETSNVMVSRYTSSCREIKQGVSQGLVLGPLLFLLYINNLPLNIHGENLVMFAGDINMLVMDSDVCALQRKSDMVIAELEMSFNRKDLILNVGKTGIISFHNRQSKFPIKPQVSFNKLNLEYKAEMKFLGTHITKILKWNSHVQS